MDRIFCLGCLLCHIFASGYGGKIISFQIDANTPPHKGEEISIICRLSDMSSSVFIYKSPTEKLTPASDNIVSYYTGYCLISKPAQYNCSVSGSSLTVTVKSLNRHVDEGWWTCRSSVDTEAQMNQFKLTVYTEPTGLYLTSATQCDLAISQCSFTCLTSCTYPKPEFDWYYSEMGSEARRYSGGAKQMENRTGTCSEWEARIAQTLVLSRYTTLPDNQEHSVVLKCRIAYHLLSGTLTSNASGLLSFAVQVQQVTISDGQNILPASANLVVTEDIDKSLGCTAGSSRPRPTITLHIGSINVIDVSNNEAKFTPINSYHNEYVYCKARNFGNTASSVTSNKVQLYVNVPIKLVEIPAAIDTQVNVILNVKEPVICNTDGGRPTSTIDWYLYRNGETRHLGKNVNISSENISPNLEKTKSVLAFRATKNDFGWKLSCSAHNLENMVPVLSRTNKSLNIMYPPTDMKVIYQQNNVMDNIINVSRGSDVILQCSADSNPAIYSYTWNSGSSSHGTVTIKGIQNSVTANCTAKNRMKTSSGNEQTGINWIAVRINVKYKPTITTMKFIVNGISKHTDMVIANETDLISIECVVDSNPTSTINILQATEVKAQRENILVLGYNISSATCSDSGVYTCKAWNSFEDNFLPTEKMRQLNIICSPRAADGTISQSVVASQNASAILSLTVLAYPVPTIYIWRKKNADTWLSLENSSAIHLTNNLLQFNLTIINVNLEDYGQYKLTVENGIGNAFHYLFALKEGETGPKPHTSDDGIAATPGIIGGVIGGLLLVFFVIIVVCIIRRRKSFDDIKTKLFGQKSSASEKEIQQQETGYSYAAAQKPTGGTALNLVDDTDAVTPGSTLTERKLDEERMPASGYLYSEINKKGRDSPLTIVQDKKSSETAGGKNKAKKTRDPLATSETLNEGSCYENPTLLIEHDTKTKSQKKGKSTKQNDKKKVSQSHDGLQYVELSFSDTKKKGKKTTPAQPKTEERTVYDAVQFGVVGAAYTGNDEENDSEK